MRSFEKTYKYKGKEYTHEILKHEIIQLKKRYPFLTVEIIGKSVEKRDLYLLKLGKGKRKIFICGGTHACEWITVPLLMKWMNEICKLYYLKHSVFQKDITKLFEKTTIYIVPMVNPDGIELQIKGLISGHKKNENLLKWNNNNKDFSKWKSNIRGVDLNRNYRAKWEECKKIERELEIKGPWFEAYAGEFPESEPETIAIANYTRQECFDMVLSYHTQGRVIYWTFGNTIVAGAEEMGKELARVSGYELDTPDEDASYGGYKDWFIQEFKKPGYTIECGFGENPLPLNQLDEIYNENFKLLLVAAWGIG